MYPNARYLLNNLVKEGDPLVGRSTVYIIKEILQD